MMHEPALSQDGKEQCKAGWSGTAWHDVHGHVRSLACMSVCWWPRCSWSETFREGATKEQINKRLTRESSRSWSSSPAGGCDSRAACSAFSSGSVPPVPPRPVRG